MHPRWFWNRILFRFDFRRCCISVSIGLQPMKGEKVRNHSDIQCVPTEPWRKRGTCIQDPWEWKTGKKRTKRNDLKTYWLDFYHNVVVVLVWRFDLLAGWYGTSPHPCPLYMFGCYIENERDLIMELELLAGKEEDIQLLWWECRNTLYVYLRGNSQPSTHFPFSLVLRFRHQSEQLNPKNK